MKKEKKDKPLTIKQEAFCHEYVKNGGVAADAYRRSYSAEKMTAESVHRRAFDVLHDGKVAARIEELKEENRERNRVTIDSLIIELEQARQAALTADTPQASAAVSATMSKAKLCGLDKQIIEQRTVVVKSGMDAFYRDLADIEADREKDDEQ